MTDKKIIDKKVSGTMNKIIFGDCLQIFKQLADGNLSDYGYNSFVEVSDVGKTKE